MALAPRLGVGPRLAVGPRLTFGPGPRFGVRPLRAFPRYGFYRGHRYLPYGYLGYNTCYRWRQVWTAYGPQYVRVNICGYPYAYRYGSPYRYY